MPNISSPTPDATTTSKGKIQLAGDLSGTAASPSVNGFGAWTTYTPTVTGFSATTTATARYQQTGKTVVINFNLSGTSNATTTTMSVPVAGKATSNIFFESALTLTQNNGGNSAPGKIYLDPSTSTTVASLFLDTAGAAWTASGTKTMRGTLIYEAA